jgi:acetylornithine/succinyldiaminopimelate/putrescine aminotransferase
MVLAMGSIRLQTVISEPRSRHRSGAMRPSHGAHITQRLSSSHEPKEIFIALTGGIGCLNSGHRPPAVIAAIHQQTDQFLQSARISSTSGQSRLRSASIAAIAVFGISSRGNAEDEPYTR